MRGPVRPQLFCPKRATPIPSLAQTIISGDHSAFGNRLREAGKPSEVDLVGRQTYVGTIAVFLVTDPT